MEKIRQGKYREIYVLDYDKLNDYTGVNAKDELKKFEYITVALITGETRAAIDGGMCPDDAFDISEAMLSRLEKAKSLDEMHEIAELAAIILAREVLISRQKKNSYVLEQCKNYIGRNIFQRIYIRNIAKYLGMNPSYLSRLFSRVEGMTLPHYIQIEKIDVACNLLKHSDRSIAKIAQYMGFCSQSNFTDAFKRCKSVSPGEYRNQNRQVLLSTEE